MNEKKETIELEDILKKLKPGKYKINYLEITSDRKILLNLSTLNLTLSIPGFPSNSTKEK